jgi:transcription elongation factor Elf1
MTLEGRMGGQVAIDICATCQAFWFDHFESLKLSPGSTLKLMKFIGEHPSPGKPSLPQTMQCPRCATTLKLAHDLQGNMPFTYWRCATDDGHFINFLEFLKEKNFIHRLSPAQIQELRQNVQFINCSNCGASINLDSLADHDRGPEWWSEASCFGLVGAGLTALARWLSDKLVD